MAAIKLSRAGLRDAEKPVGSYFILGADGRRGKQKSPVSLRSFWAWSSFVLTCPNTWSLTLSRGLSAPRRLCGL